MRSDCIITIHPKPRGNWRPRVEVSIKIFTEHNPHRPFLPGIFIAGISCHGECTEGMPDDVEFRGTPESGTAGPPVVIWLGGLGTGGEGGELPVVWHSPRRGDPSFRRGNTFYTDRRGYACSYVMVLPRRYLDDVLGITTQFYLPWRPGKSPDYTDFAAKFATIPGIVESMLEDGLDSGESAEIVITSANSAQYQRDDSCNQPHQAISRRLRLTRDET